MSKYRGLAGLLLAFLVSGCSQPGQLISQWQAHYTDPRLSLVELDGDGIMDYLLSGYAQTPGKDAAGKPIADSVVAIDGSKGKLIWGYQTQGHIAGYPTLAHDRVFVGSSDKSVYALDARRGDPLWKFVTGGPVRGSVTAGAGLVYFGSGDHWIYALNALKGKVVWRYQTGKAVDTTPALANGRLFVGGWDRTLYAFDAAKGKLLWTFRAKGPFAASSPVVAQGIVYIGNWDQNLYALDAATGQLRWQYQTAGAIEASPVLAAERVYFGSQDHNLYVIDRKTGVLRWSYTASEAIHASVAVSELGVYVNSGDGFLTALDVRGKLRWRHKTGGDIRSAPALAGKMVLTGSPTGGLLRYYDPFSQVYWGMAGGEPEHHSLAALAAKEGETLARSRIGWWPARIWSLLPSSKN